MISFEKFQKSLARLEEQQEALQGLDPALPGHIQEAVAESVIKRYTICYECLLKALRLYLKEVISVTATDVNRGHKFIFRLANEHKVFESPLDRWLRYVQARISTTHDYDGEVAKDCLELVPDFIEDAKCLYLKITGEKWVRGSSSS